MVNEISKHLLKSIADNLDNVTQLRILLLLHETPERDWTDDAVGRRLNMRYEEAASDLETLARRGFFLATLSANPAYRYAPRSLDHANFADLLAQLDHERPVTLINLIHSNTART